MYSFDCEEYLDTHLLSINDAKYCIGLFQQEGLLVKGEWVIRISKNENDVYERFDYNLKTKELKMSKKEKTDYEFISVSNVLIESNCVIDITNDGMRWEGSCLNHSPFGYGSMYDSSNQLIYRGVMIGDRKECFGIEFYPDLGLIEYIGCYWNNDKHGFGMLYNHKGELAYEGAFICGTSFFEKSLILKGIDDDDNENSDEMNNDDSIPAERRSVVLNVFEDTAFHSLINELVIDAGYGNEYKGNLLLCGLEHLEKLVMKNSFRNVTSLKISENPVLKSLEIEEASFSETRSLSLSSSLIYD